MTSNARTSRFIHTPEQRPIAVRKWITEGDGLRMAKNGHQGVYAVRARLDELSNKGRQGKPIVKLGRFSTPGRLWGYNNDYGDQSQGGANGVDILAIMDMGPAHVDSQGHEKPGTKRSNNAENILLHRARYLSWDKYRRYVDSKWQEIDGVIYPGDNPLPQPPLTSVGTERGRERFHLTNADVKKIFDDSKWDYQKDWLSGRRSLRDPGQGSDPPGETADRITARLRSTKGQEREIEGDFFGKHNLRKRGRGQ